MPAEMPGLLMVSSSIILAWSIGGAGLSAIMGVSS
jgi:hypothetical protein